MGKPKRLLHATAEETSTPPQVLPDGQTIAKVMRAEGNNLWSVRFPKTEVDVLVELPSRFRSTIWLKRGGFVLVDTSAFVERDNKLAGEILNVVRDEKQWRKQPYWPSDFVKSSTFLGDSDDDSRMGKMPPSSEDDM